MEEPNWANVSYKKPNYQDVIYYSAPKQKPVLDSLDDLESLEDTMKGVVISNLEEKDTEQNDHYEHLIEQITTTISENETDEVATVNLNTLRVPELKKMAKERNIKTKGLRKAELITALSQN